MDQKMEEAEECCVAWTLFSRRCVFFFLIKEKIRGCIYIVLQPPHLPIMMFTSRYFFYVNSIHAGKGGMPFGNLKYLMIDFHVCIAWFQGNGKGALVCKEYSSFLIISYHIWKALQCTCLFSPSKKLFFPSATVEKHKYSSSHLHIGFAFRNENKAKNSKLLCHEI